MTSQPHVVTPTGMITGAWSNNHTVRRFYSIPYANFSGEFDDAELRTANGDVDASTPSPDAVALTVATPADAHDHDDLPVIVFIHGGSFETGSHDDPRHDATANVQAGCVQVNIGYRKKLPGFARFNNDAPGHYRGVHDCLLALEWIQRNIESFGGDPTNVTLAGQSAGANLVLWLCRPDHYRGGFRRAIAMSPASPREPIEARTSTLRMAMQVPLTRRRLAELPQKKLDRGYQRFKYLHINDVALGPDLRELGELADVPLWVSTTHDEFHHHPLAATDSKPWVRSVPGSKALFKKTARDLQLSRNFDAWMEGVLALDPYRPMGRLLTDALIGRWAASAITKATGPVWLSEYYRSTAGAVQHSSDIAYLFGVSDGDNDSASEHAGRRRLHEALLSFARTGNPGFDSYSATGRTWRLDFGTGQATMSESRIPRLAEYFPTESRGQ
ncbi:carboxylesterase family protein [Corynebacterium pseudodiphtheriticum]|uniref:carboxylesterase family protein n=1 Tax=Corynebacterium pseudodiphtheriticum TaxID=37637 RepID=UPI0025512F9D|nr:carboxylesterase family protein [Corynebacterium pseudodiphtheriticum]MDK8717504.1 carboxylesterase family protein [Corynebacterium pseudodiphtheriticum]